MTMARLIPNLRYALRGIRRNPLLATVADLAPADRELAPGLAGTARYRVPIGEE